MTQPTPPTILCLASYEKGHDFLREAKRLGCYIIFVTAARTQDAPWPHECIDEFFTMPRLNDRQEVLNAVSYLARDRHIERIVGLDDYDIEMAATLREHMRVPGMGDTTARYFRDKLAMRVQALDKGILVPPFVHVLNYDKIRAFTERIQPPWMLKPRSEAASMGLRKIENVEQLWEKIEALGDRRSYYVLEKYIPGEVYHVDSLVFKRELLLAEVGKYKTPPFNSVHGGDISGTRTMPRDSEDAVQLREMHNIVLGALGFVRGVTHMEFIKGQEDGRFYFLETAARVPGAYTVEMIEAATGVNLWAEWAKVEVAGQDGEYAITPARQEYAGIMLCLARQEHPDTGAYSDPEVVWRLDKLHHIGLILRSTSHDRIEALMDDYLPRIRADFLATQPALDKPPE